VKGQEHVVQQGGAGCLTFLGTVPSGRIDWYKGGRLQLTINIFLNSANLQFKHQEIQKKKIWLTLGLDATKIISATSMKTSGVGNQCNFCAQRRGFTNSSSMGCS